MFTLIRSTAIDSPRDQLAKSKQSHSDAIAALLSEQQDHAYTERHLEDPQPQLIDLTQEHQHTSAKLERAQEHIQELQARVMAQAKNLDAYASNSASLEAELAQQTRLIVRAMAETQMASQLPCDCEAGHE